MPNSYSLQRAGGSHRFSHHFLLLDMIHPLAILIVVSPECCIALVEGFIYYELCIYMVLELSTSYELIIICFSKRPVPSAKKKTDVTGIFAGCWNQNFGKGVRRNKACQIDQNGTVGL